MTYEYKNITVKNLPEKGSKAYQLLKLCSWSCDFEDGGLNHMMFGSNIAVFSFWRLVKEGIYKTVVDAEKNAHDDFMALIDIKIWWNGSGEWKGCSSEGPVFGRINRDGDLIVVWFIPIEIEMPEYHSNPWASPENDMVVQECLRQKKEAETPELLEFWKHVRESREEIFK